MLIEKNSDSVERSQVNMFEALQISTLAAAQIM